MERIKKRKAGMVCAESVFKNPAAYSERINMEKLKNARVAVFGIGGVGGYVCGGTGAKRCRSVCSY